MKLNQLETLVQEMRRCAKANMIDNPEVLLWECNRGALLKTLDSNPVFLTLDIDPEVLNKPISEHTCAFDSEEQRVKRGDYHLPIRVVPIPV